MLGLDWILVCKHITGSIEEIQICCSEFDERNIFCGGKVGSLGWKKQVAYYITVQICIYKYMYTEKDREKYCGMW